MLLSACGNGAIPEKPGSHGSSSTPGGFTPAPGSSSGSTPSSAVVTTSGGQSVTAVASSGTIVRAQSLATPSSAPTSFSYPMGFFAFDISGLTPGTQITLTLTLPAGSAPTAYVKCIGDLCAPFSGATIGGNQIQLLLTDGGAGDSDGIANGVIRDPGGPAFATTVEPPVTTQCSDGIDNDNDGKIDFGGQNPDPGCSSADDDDETDPVAGGCPLQPGSQALTSWEGSVLPSVIGLFGDSHAFTLPSDCPITSMTVQITWQPRTPVNLEDLDLTLTPPDGADPIQAQETNFFGEALETILVANPVAGEYTADINGFVSLATSYSGRVTVFVASIHPECSDGIDNDGDGKIDFGGPNGDPGCESASDNSELDPPPPPQCSDGIDNDGDGKIDFGGPDGDPGCDSATDNDEADVVVPQNAPRVVVSDIDSGINPYHIFYNACTTYTAGPNPGRKCSPIYPENAPPRSVTPKVLEDFGIDEAHRITLTRTGDYAADFAADKAKWDAIVPGELYWFTGTNIIAASFDPAAQGSGATAPKILPNDEDDTHGVGTAAAVLVANPEAIILFAETGDDIGADAAEHLGFLHPLVDIVTTSYGPVIPVVGQFTGAGFASPFFTDSFDSVVTLGKLHFSSASNFPDLYTPETGSRGPWWVASVAGIEEGSSEGRTVLSGFFTDFVSDYTQTLPYCAACEDGYDEFVSGTSFATPRSAGVASKVLLDARRRMNHLGGIVTVDGKPVLAAAASGQTISLWQLRRALEQAAYVPSVTDFDPLALDIALPVLNVTPWLLVGWGDLSAKTEKDVINQTLAALGFGTLTRTKPAGTCEFQSLNMDRRMLYWNNVGFFFNEFTPPDENPYIYCE